MTTIPFPDPNRVPPNLPSSVQTSELDRSIPILHNYINGTFESDDSTISSYILNKNPAKNTPLCYIPSSGASQVDRAVKAARDAHRLGIWRKYTPHERASKLYKIADLIEESYDKFAKTESMDIGKPESVARAIDIDRAIKNFRFFAGAILHTNTSHHDMGTNVGFNYTSRRPIGVVGIIKAWNLSIYLLTWAIAPALACGNCVVVKASELTPMTASLLAEIIHKVDLPPGTFNLVHGYGSEVGSSIVSHKDVQCISFTGGTVTGRKVGSIAGTMIKKCSLELGGKNSMIVFDDADLDKATDIAVRSSFANQGQICLCCSRILIQSNVYDQFVNKFIEKVKKIKIGDPSDKDTTMGSLVSLQHREKVLYYIDLAKAEGGKVLFGGKIPSNLSDELKEGAFLEPTIIADLAPNSRTATEEIFGPVVTLHKFESDNEAITYANMVEYGLCASVQTTSLHRAHKVSEELETGMVWVNTWLLRDLRVPFGGVKNSGIGREGGDYSLEFFSEDKNICIAY